jgi:hypothetical protein
VTSTLTAAAPSAQADERQHGRRAAIPAGPRHATVHGPRLRHTRRIVLAAGVVALTIGGGVAWAFVQARGSGSGTATIGSPGSFVVLAETGNGLAPDGQLTSDVSVTNAYHRSLAVQAITAAGPATLVGSGHSGCNPAAVTFTATVDPAAPASTLAPGAQATFAGTVRMASTATSDCQGATFRIPVTVSARLS